MSKAMRGGADEVTFGDVLRFNGGGAYRPVAPATADETRALHATGPLAEFGPCRCATCDGFGSSSAPAVAS